MKKSLLIASFAAFTLVGCGGEEQVSNGNGERPQALIYSYPLDAQAAVPTSAPVILRFSSPLQGDPVELSQQFSLQHGNQSIGFTNPRLSEDGKSLIMAPAQPLAYSTQYQVVGTEDALPLPAGGVRFTTTPASRGPLLEQTEGTGAFRIARMMPDGTAAYPATDMSVLRMQLTEPVRAETVRYGETLSILDMAGNLVPAEVHVRGHKITVDPTEELVANRSYQVEITDGIRSRIGNAPIDTSHSPWTFTAADTAPRGRMAQSTVSSNAGNLVSMLSGEALNSVGLSSLLLGNDSATEASGTVFAELGNIPRFEREGKSIPLRISRESMMTGSKLDVFVAGQLPAGFDSGDIAIRFISDASGFLRLNPYLDRGDAPRVVELFLDLSMGTEDNVAHGAFAQELLHVHLVGLASVEEGLMTIDAVGVIEPEVLGVDVASGLITFQLRGYRNAAAEPREADFRDTTAPTVKSWVPGEDGQNKIQPGDPVVVFFDKPLRRSSVHAPGNVELLSDASGGGINTVEAATLELNGSALTVRPTQPLRSNRNYILRLNNLEDLSGNAMLPADLAFALPVTGQINPTNQAPLPLTARPGFPCAKANVNLNAGHQGRCSGGKNESREYIPLLQHPSNSPLIVRFSQNMNPNSFVAGQTVFVQTQLDGSWVHLPTDEYVLQVSERELRIEPVAGWIEGQRYAYTLVSNNIRSVANLPLQSELLTQGTRNASNRTFGGPNMVNYFVAGPASSNLALPLRNLPTLDVNSDLGYSHGVEPFFAGAAGDQVPNSARIAATGVSPINTSTVVQQARIGCRVGDSCPGNRQFIHLTAGLDVDIYGTPNDQGELEVDIFPSVLATTGNDVWVRIDTSFIDAFPNFILSVDLNQNERIPTGPMLMRILYQDNGPAKGYLFNDDSGQLMFRTTLNVLLDAPYLNPSLGPANLSHNLRSYLLPNLQVRGPVTFLDDGRMQISLTNQNAIPINVDARGSINITGQNTGGLCGIWPFTYVCGGIANVAVDANTRIHLSIPAGQLSLNYISPITRQ
ncbi:MAG: Ig-like domain-containing protein [Marinobacter sp.]|nr:Ig-like domain-containing protein [Marinobacter sp.]